MNLLYKSDYSAGHMSKNVIRKSDRKQLSDALEIISMEKKMRENINHGLSRNFILNLFFTAALCMQICKGDFRSMFVAVPVVLYNIYKGWKEKRPETVIDAESLFYVISLIPGVILFRQMYMEKDYSSIIFMTAVYLPFYIKGIMEFILRSIRALKGDE